MYRKILISGVTAAAIVGAGGTALAVSGTPDNSAGTPSSSSSSSSAGSSSASSAAKGAQQGKGDKTKGDKAKGDKTKKAKGGKRMLRKLSHGEFVTRHKGDFITHNIARGTVSAVSATSITVRSADKTSHTFTVTKDTKVMHRVMKSKEKPSASSIDKVSKGDRVGVVGPGASRPTAKRVAYITAK